MYNPMIGFHPKVEPTMDYLHELTASGHKVVDVMLTRIRQDMCRMWVYFPDDTYKHFYIEQSDRVFPHFREAVEYCDYGPRGLGNVIHADLCQKIKETGIKMEDYIVSVSTGVFERLGRHGEHWTHYGYSIVVDSRLPGMSYVFTPKKEASDG